jgi:hypothetical protein
MSSCTVGAETMIQRAAGLMKPSSTALSMNLGVLVALVEVFRPAYLRAPNVQDSARLLELTPHVAFQVC